MFESIEERVAQAKASFERSKRYHREALAISRKWFPDNRAAQFRALAEAAMWRTFASIWPAELRHLRELAS